MNMHHNARLTPKGRELLIERLERGVPPPQTPPAQWRPAARRFTSGGGGIGRKVCAVYKTAHHARTTAQPGRLKQSRGRSLPCAGRSAFRISLPTKLASPAPPSPGTNDLVSRSNS